MLVRVTAFAVARLPINTLPKAMLVAESVTGAMPLPVTLAVCGLLPASSFTFRTADRAPELPGVNITLIVQLSFGARLDPQLLFCEKSPKFVPVKLIDVIFSVAA